MPDPILKADCRYFRGDKPCRFGYPCDNCLRYDPIRQKALVIKARAQGDVLRTTPLLAGLKRKYPGSFLTWLTDAESLSLLEGNPYIDRLLALDLESVLALEAERFDMIICLDKEPGLAGLATRLEAGQKFGFGLNPQGNLVPFNASAEYAYRLGQDDELKFRLNTKTYQHIVAEVAEVDYRRDEYVFSLKPEAAQKAAAFFKRRRVPRGQPAIGLNTGAGAKFETKQWPEEHFLELIRLLQRQGGVSVLLLGGPREAALNARLAKRSEAPVFHTGTDNTLLEFAGLLSLMDVVVCSDTLAMHLAIALKKQTVVLFGPTCPQEIDLYDRGIKLFAGADCAPCYKQTCHDKKCLKAVTPEHVFQAVRSLLAKP